MSTGMWNNNIFDIKNNSNKKKITEKVNERDIWLRELVDLKWIYCTKL